MIKPETFKKFTTGGYMWHCSPAQFDEIFRNPKARKIAHFFEFDKDAPDANGYRVTADRATFLNEAVAGRRPHLAAQIWESVYDLAKRQDSGIGALDISFIQDMNLDLGTVILLILIIEETIGDIATPLSIVNRDGSKMMAIKANLRRHSGKKFVVETASFYLSKKIFWSDNHIYMPQLPDTIKTSLPGKKLISLISHPLIDHLDNTIKGVTDTFGLLVMTDYYPQVISITDLAKAEIEKLTMKKVAV